MDIQNQKQAVINKRFELNQQIKTYRKAKMCDVITYSYSRRE